MPKGGKKKKEKWVKRRHRIVTFILRWTLGVYARIKYGIRVERFRDAKRQPYLILLNHQTAFDQFFVGMAFDRPVYYLASEDLFSMGWVSSLIRFLVAPIPIKKQTTDVKAILTCLRVAKEGGTIAIAPEGNRTYSGQTAYMSPSIAPLARKLGMPIALFRIEGGYGVQPRWSDVVRKGKMRAYVSRVIEPEEYASLSDDELFAEIQGGLWVDEAKADACFRHKKRAEYLERAIYVCPSCGLSALESSGDVIGCLRCGKKVRYKENLELEGVDGYFPFRFVADWYRYEEHFINELALTPYFDTPMYTERAALLRVIPYKKKERLAKDVSVLLYGNAILISGEREYEFLFDEVSAVTVLGKNKVNVYHGGEIYQLKGDERFCGLKYVHIYHRYRNLQEGKDGKFLGI